MHCVNSVKNSVSSLKGVSKVDIDLAGKKVMVAFDPEKVELDTIEKTIENSGYKVV